MTPEEHFPVWLDQLRTMVENAGGSREEVDGWIVSVMDGVTDALGEALASHGHTVAETVNRTLHFGS